MVSQHFIQTFPFKNFFQIFGCFLAWETRAVNVPALNDSKYIGMCVYNVVVMSVIGVSLAFILQVIGFEERFFVDLKILKRKNKGFNKMDF